jgi:hypothetical protein
MSGPPIVLVTSLFITLNYLQIYWPFHINLLCMQQDVEKIFLS